MLIFLAILCLALYLYSDMVLQAISTKFSVKNNTLKVVLVTGAGSGLGKATTLRLINTGNFVFALDLNVSSLEAIKREKNNLFIFKTDVTEVDSIQKVCNDIKKLLIEKNLDGLDAIINFAGINILGPLLELSTENFENLFKVNVFGSLNIIKSGYKLLRKRNDYFPRIINISSEVAHAKISSAFTPYCLTKLCIQNLSTQLRSEIQFLNSPETEELSYKDYAHVVTLYPGACQTEMTDSNMMMKHLEKVPNSLWKHSIEESISLLNIYLGDKNKMTKPDEVARKIELILSTKTPLKKYTIGISTAMRFARITPVIVQDLSLSWFLGCSPKNIRQWF